MGRVFIGMETSGQVRRRLVAMGHHVVSCDLLPSADGAGVSFSEILSGQSGHVEGDVFVALGLLSEDLGWQPDSALFHPDCTYLTSSGEWAFKDPDFDRYPGVGYHQKVKPGTLTGADRRAARDAAIKDWERIDALPVPRKIAENPARGALSSRFRGPDQVIHPPQFGDDASKATGIWLWNAPKLKPTGYVEPRTGGLPLFGGDGGLPRWANQTGSGQNRLSPGADRWQKRSETYPGIADALAIALVTS